MIVNVDDFIELTDTDETAAIQAAIDSVSQYTPVNYAPEVVLTAARIYEVSETILIPYGVRVTAHGSVIQSTITDGSPVIQWGNATHKPWVGSWHGGTIKGSSNIGFKVERANHGVIEDVKVGNCDIGIAIDGADPVQWEIRRCFVSGSSTAGIRAHRANVLRIVGGKIHSKNKPGAVGLHVTSSASVSVDSLDISICEAGAATFSRCTGLDVRSLYTERCGGVPYNDQAVVSLSECYGFSFSGCRFNAANGTVTGNTSLAWGLDITDCDGGCVSGSMATTARKGFARITDSHRVEVTGCTDDYFGKLAPRIERNDKTPTSPELIKPTWRDGLEITRGIAVSGGTITFGGGDPDSRGYIDVMCDYEAGDTFRVCSVLDVLSSTTGNEAIVKADIPVLLAWMQNPADLTDHNKSDPRTLVPLRVGNVQEVQQDWTTTTAGSVVRLHIGTRQHWPGFSLKPRFLSLRKVA